MRARAHTHFLDFLFHFVCLHFVPGFEPASDRWWTLAASQQPMLSATAEYSITRFVCRSCEQQERDSMRKKKKAKHTTTAVSSRSSNGSSSNSEYNIFETNMFRWKLWQLLSCAISFFAFLLLLFPPPSCRCRRRRRRVPMHLSAHHFGTSALRRDLFVSCKRQACARASALAIYKKPTRWNRLNLILFYDLCWYLMCVVCALLAVCAVRIWFEWRTTPTVAHTIRDFMNLFIGWFYKHIIFTLETDDRESRIRDAMDTFGFMTAFRWVDLRTARWFAITFLL